MLTIKKQKGIFDYLIYIASILGPIMTVPQAYTIWSSKSADDVSLITWVTYTILSLVWLLYGILHKERPIIVLNILLLVVNTAVVLGVLVYS